MPNVAIILNLELSVTEDPTAVAEDLAQLAAENGYQVNSAAPWGGGSRRPLDVAQAEEDFAPKPMPPFPDGFAPFGGLAGFGGGM